jgi:hypothetical protein
LTNHDPDRGEHRSGQGSSHGDGGARRKNGGGSATSAATASHTAAVLGFDFKTSLAGEGFVPAGIRQWLKYDAQGRMTVIPADKRPLIEGLHLPFRDAVMVNPLVPTPYPPTIFIRDAALVLNLGSLRACVGADRVRRDGWMERVGSHTTRRTPALNLSLSHPPTMYSTSPHDVL